MKNDKLCLLTWSIEAAYDCVDEDVLGSHVAPADALPDRHGAGF